MDLGLTGETALVLGGGKGIGRGISEALISAGAKVLLTSRKLEDAERAAAEIGAGAKGLACDTSDPASVAALAGQVEASLDPIGILVLNSGGPPAGPASVITIGAYRAAFEQLFAGPVDLALRLLPAMRTRGFGRIMTVGSSGMIEPIPNLAISNAIRPAIAGWSKSLAQEVAADGVTVNVLIPGRIATDRTSQIDTANAARTGQSLDQVRAASQARIPVGRYGTIAEFGAAAAFLASRQAGFITGSFLRVDGGQLLSVG
ncbi:3-oxoacyl-ACP reductase [Pararhizobium polonicum]|uniref:3-oxoacyl-ACP reductase n=1 Tax=Pararhizobium polonicum TaxID=1612624 RepID=A0A1C7NWW8_9HYPH|nr:SDR family oxidoreductase [Pararhizobium polonicum]OBZ93513.1 3-oxoacyl-ACP reductase [Pararhizobium polonicum]